MPDVDPLTTPWRPDQVHVMHQLRDWANAVQEVNRHLAAWTGLPSSDADALGQLVWAAESGEPLSPAELSRRVGLTSGATTTLVDRLEARGHVVRTRESTDRRRVTLRPTEQARDQVRAFLVAAGEEIDSALRAADPAELAAVASFVGRMAEAATQASARMARRR